MVFYGIKINKALAFVSVALACGFASNIALAHDTLAKNMTTTNNATPANNERERVTSAQKLSSYKSSLRALQRNAWQSKTKNAIQNIDCHDSTLRAESRNDDGRVDCHANAIAFARNDGIISPSLCGGGLRGWVSYPNTHKRTIQNPNPCHTEGVARSISKSKNVSRDISRSRAQYDNKRDASISTKSQYDSKHSVIADNDSASVIASERSERGNPQRNTENIDCHDSTLRAESRNDGNYCHTGQSEVTQSNNRDTSFSAKPQYDKDDKTKFDNVKSSLRALQRNAWQSTTKNIGGNPQCNTQNIDCHENPSGFSRNDTHPLLSPSAREGEIIQNNESSTQTNPQKYIKLAQVDSIRTDFAQAYLPQATMDSKPIASNTENAQNQQNNDFVNNHRDISHYALNTTNGINSTQTTDFAQIDFTKTTADFTQTKSMKIASTNATAKSTQIDSIQMDSAQADSTPQTFSKPRRQNKQKSKDLESTNLEAKDLGKVTATGHKESISAYQSGASIGKGLLDSSPSGNGDITSILKILPNVQFDTASGSSNTPGEIDPAKISISGGLYFQNNFQIDGFNMNNDLDPAGGQTTDNQTSIRSGNSQGLNIDTSLLDSITVLDSNVSASYGGFSGGVVKAEVRKARKDGWHGNISYQFTQGNADISKFSLTKYHIDDTVQTNTMNGQEVSAWQRLWYSSSEAYQPQFTKHLVKSSLEGYITEKLGFVASFTTTQSFIPLRDTRVTDTGTYNYGEGRDGKREQKRQSYNYYLKAHYDFSDYITMEANIGYAPQYNTYYNDTAANSYYAMESGGWQGGAKVMWQTPIGLWTNSFGYSKLENSRRGESDHFYFWYRSVDKDWAGMRALVYEGGWGNVDQLQNKLELKSEFESNPIRFSLMRNTLKFGIGFEQFEIVRDYLNDVYWNQGAPTMMSNANYRCGVDSMGFADSCSESPTLNATTGKPNPRNYGQFQSTIRLRPKGKYEYWGKNFNAYLEDDIRIDLGISGELNLRPGIRYDGDSYMGKHSLAPRFALNYTTPAPKEWRTKLTFGANRYYGRNLFTYWLYAQSYKTWKVYRRSMCTKENQKDCIEVNTPTAWAEPTDYNLSSFFHFDKLKVPYDDELMGGITQNLDIFEVGIKYIHRFGRDEIMRQDTGSVQGRADYYWNNNGSSDSDIVAFIIQNVKPIQTFGLAHHYLFALDWTHTRRGYNIQFNTHDGTGRDGEEYTNNGMIYYDGKLMHYRDRPVENFLRPWTLRFNTTHRFNVGRTRWMLNNFFRFRAKYERMLNNGGININGENYPRYDKIPFNAAFSWDMRVGFEVDIYRGEAMRHTVYVNMDIFNVLNARNKTTMQGALVTNGVTPGISSVTGSTGLTDFAVYETGRQFWFQVGYKF